MVKTIVWLLVEALKTLLRIEHKLDALIRIFKAKHEVHYIPPLTTKANDPISGQVVKYTKVLLPDGFKTTIRESSEEPVSTELPKNIQEIL